MDNKFYVFIRTYQSIRYIYIDTRVIQEIRDIFPKELPVRSTVYSWNFPLKPKVVVPEDRQHDFCVKTAAPRTFNLLQSQCVSFPWTVFSIQARNGEPIIKTFFHQKVLRTNNPFLCKVHMICTYLLSKI